MVDLIMLAAPYGVFALLASLIAESPSVDLFKRSEERRVGKECRSI